MAGTSCQPYRDLNFEGEAEEFQHMCSDCSDAKRGEWRWDTYHRPSNPQASVQPEIVSDEEMHQLAAAEEAEFDVHMAAVDAVQCRGCDDGEAAEQQQQQDGVRFLTHAEERAALGKPIWTEISGQIPRAQQDGRLGMPKGAVQREVYMEAFVRAFPALPYIKPPPAAARAAALIDASDDGVWTAERQAQALDFYACEAANVEACIIMPEVTAREEMLMHERYQVREGGKVVGAKLCCAGCGHNEWVLVGDVNVDSVSNVRFAYGNSKAIMVISRSYTCFNPACPDVIATRTTEQRDRLRAHVAAGITGATAAAAKKVTELLRLGVSWFGHDARVMKQLPRKVRSRLWKGGAWGGGVA